MVKLKTVRLRSVREFQMIKITGEVADFVARSGVQNGLVAVITAHTTTGIMMNESLPCVEEDIEEALERLIPKDSSYMHAHFRPSYGTTCGNSPGHLKSMLSGNNCILPVQDGKMVIGHAQDIYFVEFDGLKMRSYFIEVIGE